MGGKKIEEANMTLGDFESQKRRLAAENADLLRVAGDIANNVNMVGKMKGSLVAALDDAKHNADNEARERGLLLGKFKNVEHELDGLKEAFEEELAGRENINRQTSKAEGEAAMWRNRYESDAVAKAEDLEMTKMKLQARLTEAESMIDNLNGRHAQIEKAKEKIKAEIDEMNVSLDQAQILNNSMERKARNFDKLAVEWKRKVDGLGMDLDVAQKECRNASSDLFKVKAAYEESIAQLDEVRRENKGLSNEIKDIMDQISEGGRSIHEIDKIRKRLEAEKLELQAALEEAEGALEQEESKVLRAQLELGQVRQEIDRRIQEKEEEFDNTRKNHQRAMESLGASLEAEQRAKGEALRIKKKLESDINELEIALDHANKANAEGQKAIKRYQGQLRETIQGYEEQARGRQEVMEAVGIAERKAGALSGEVEESRALLDSADRGKRQIDAELADARNAVTEMQVINGKAMHDKRGLESVIHTLQAEIDDALQAAKNSEDKSKRAMVDSARLADELRAEQDHVQAESRAKRTLDTQLGELENRLADAEAAAAKGGKTAMAKLEMKIRELELELGSVQSRTGESYKAFQRAERRVKELQFQQEEDRKNQDRMGDLANKLQQKIKTYKQQIEEAEEIAALNLAKYRKAQQELEETEERGKMAGARLEAL